MHYLLTVVRWSIVAAVLSGPVAAEAALSPTETVNEAIASMMHILNDPRFKQPGMAEARRAAIENVLRDFLSYQDMARHALGTTWVALSAAERQEFMGLFIRLLRDAVACRIHEYSTAQIHHLAEQRAGVFASVQTSFSGDKVDTLIDIRLANRSGQWLVYDVVVDGVSLLDNYRAQFGQVMRASSYIGLVRTIEDNTIRPKSFEYTVSP